MAGERSRGCLAWLVSSHGREGGIETSDGGGLHSALDVDISRIDESGVEDSYACRHAGLSDGVRSQHPDELIEHFHSVPHSSNTRSFRRSFEGQSSSTVLSLSPPHSPRLGRRNASKQFNNGATSILEEAEPQAAIASGYVGFAGDFNISEEDQEIRTFDIPIDYIPLQRLKYKVEAGEDDADKFLEAPLMESLQTGSVHGIAAMTGRAVERAEVPHPQEELQNVRRRSHARSAAQHVHTPDKIHRKRAKVLPFLSRRQPSTASSAAGSSLASSNSSTRQSLHMEGWGKDDLSLGPPLNSPSDTLGGNEGNMETDNGGDEDKDGNTEESKDNEPCFDLTDDLLLKVFSFLDHITLCHAAMVCRQWRAASAHEDFWKSLNFENRQITNVQVAELCARYPKATELHLKGTSNVDEGLVRDAMRSLRNLEMLTLGRSFLSDSFFYALSDRASLRKLTITDAVLGSGGAQEVQLRHEGLLALHIIKCRVLRIAIRCPHLEELSLTRTGTASAMLHCPRLTNLDVSSCHKLSDIGVRAAAVACPLLASLNMSHCAYVTDDTLREISLACAHLQTLDASYCPNISLEGVLMPMLTELRLQSCEGINSSSMVALSHCVMLEVLAMDYCWLLTSVNLDLPHLRSISLSNNRKLVELTLRSSFLVSLDLNHCSSLHRIDLASSSLPRLDLKQQSSLASMALHCPWVQVVDLSECDSLTDLVCNVFSDGGGCPKLNSLILDNCDGLVKVVLSTSSLEKLSLIGCRKISLLDLSCPVLQHLHLDGCDHLVDAAFAPVGLQSLNLGICPHLTNLVIEADQLTTLDLRGCGVLSQASINCPRLSSLDASYCSQLGDKCLATTASACPAIQHLVLAACFAVGPAGLLTLKNLVDLIMLDLSYTFLTDLSPVFEACPRLKVLRLSACKYLEETALDALHGGKKLSELQELDISYGSLGRRAIEGVLAHCPHLNHISLNGCAHVTDQLWTRLCTDGEHANMWIPRALQSLSCVGCQNVRFVTMRAHSCLHLSSINLSLSTNIREVYLTCVNLISINLSNCAALVLLNLDCPRLATLSLQGCGIEDKMLEVALQGCAMLETLDLRNCAKVTAAGLVPIRGLCPGLKRLYSTILQNSGCLFAC